MQKVNGWVFEKSRKIGIFRNARLTTFKLLTEGKTFTPYFSSPEKARIFAERFQALGVDMRRYQIAYAEGLVDEGDLVLDLDATKIVSHVAGDLRPQFTDN